MIERNALAELAESMKRKIGDFSADESFMANLATLENANSPEDQKAAAFFREYALASCIVAELAKITYSPAGLPENPLFAMYCLDRCRAIAEGCGVSPIGDGEGNAAPRLARSRTERERGSD